MQVVQLYTHSNLRNFTYLLIDQEQNQSLCIDPFDADQVYTEIQSRKLNLVAIINTHEHWDHIQGNEKLQQLTHCEIWAHRQARGKIPHIDRELQAGDRLKLNMKSEFDLEVMDTPGHTFAHVCLLLRKEQQPIAVFTGDTLFNAGVGNCHHGGGPKILYRTIAEQFQNLDDAVKVYPGHEYLGNNLRFTLSREPDNTIAKLWLERYQAVDPNQVFFVTTMQDEKQINTFLRLENKALQANLPSQGAGGDEQVFLELRKLRNQW